MWVRNGLQIKGQAMTYIQANFCNSMVDMDLFFLQLCATHLPAQTFLTTAIDVFGVSEWLGMGPLSSPQEVLQDSMLEGLLTFLATLITSRTNLGNDEKTQCIIEISALLATFDKTHSQLLELMPERSGNAHTRNFEKFLKELSVYRPPLSGSENLEQGLFIPVADTWENHYDPLHVLLRAVHRRDFQNSMDRFSNYVKQAKKMPKSGNLWPPFRLPGPVGKAYSDPSCLLSSRVLHSALLGIFYRAVHSHNVSEHLLALAVFLLEMAVTFNETSTKNSVLECSTFEPSSPFRRQERDPPELLDCYPGDCLSENLRLNVSKVSLALPEPQISPVNYNTTTFDSDLEWDVSESDTMPMLPSSVETMDLILQSNMEIALPQDLSIVREQSLVLHNPNDIEELPQLPLPDSMQALALPEYSAAVRIPVHLALPQSTSVIPDTGMEVAIRRTTSEMFHPNHLSAIPALLAPFQRVQPVAVPSRSTDVVAATTSSTGQRRYSTSNSGGGGGGGNNGRQRQVEGNSIVIEESILSLLLKLHSQMSGTLDSFSMDEEQNFEQQKMDVDMDPGPSTSSTNFSSQTEQQKQKLESRIGDGPHFIGNLLRKIGQSDENCARNIDEIRQRLWPNQRERQAEQKARENREKDERSKRARERQQKLMQEFADKQKEFMEQAGGGMDCCDEDEYEIEQQREKEYHCIICNTSSPSTELNPIGLVVLVESTSVIGHRRKTTEKLGLPLCDEDKQKPGRSVRLFSEFNRRVDLLNKQFGETSWYPSNNLSWEGGVHIQSCGHHVHIICQDTYLKSLYSSQRPHTNLNVERGEFFCPVCRQLANSVLPLSPQLDKPTPVIRLPTPPFITLVSELATLIRENEVPPVSFFLIFFKKFFILFLGGK